MLLRTALAPLFALSFSGCTSCNSGTVSTRGNVDRISDTAIVRGSDDHSYAMLANPELQHLRVLDLTTGAFVTGPNRYFPLSVPVGADTRRLAVAVDPAELSRGLDGGRVYALDGSDDAFEVITTVETGVTSFSVLGAPNATGRAPSDLAALRIDAEHTTVFVTLPDAGVVQAFLVDRSTGVASPLDEVVLPAGSRPGAIAVDPTGTSIVVADEALPLVHVLRRDDEESAVLDRSLPVRGPSSHVAIGVVDVGDGLAPVALLLRDDAPEVTAVRLFRAGFREDGAQVLGSTELPSLPLAAYVPDARLFGDTTVATVCCRGMSDDGVARGEATAAWAAVSMANGQMVYLQLAAPTATPGRTLVRLVDDDGVGLSFPDGVDPNTDAAAWVPTTGGEALRPTVAVSAADTFGTPAHVPLLAGSAGVHLVYEGDLPDLAGLRANLSPQTPAAVVAVDVRSGGARVGDVVRFTMDVPPPGCDGEPRARIEALDVADVDGAPASTLTLARVDALPGVPGVSTDELGCLEAAGPLRVTIEARGAFVATTAQGMIGRLALLPADGSGSADIASETALPLDGAVLTATSNAAGAPVRGSVLDVALDAHITTMGLNLSAAALALGGGGFGQAAYVPTGIVGGLMRIPGSTTGETIEARRMVFTTASPEATLGQNLVYTADEAETSSARVETFR